ncbi:hypothetical protein BCR35DRAFT_302781 [Leucosporidium creatinivorum]|uniref:HAUS augmin-like complex subunit 6 N-terminal domain-containing protein n=1 Tax=Leucosporidium creatinivorum TaxID=106004 RepID=A0A1Y2FPR2_9BASI|nr:hypothetical protein BCR35DRAFT_302781 [Leucosporidium creatinivorum]
MSWINSIQLLIIPNTFLLIGPYSPSTLSQLSPCSFQSTSPLTHRLRHADLILYSLLTHITPSLVSQLPLWPPLDHQAAVKLRAELSKQVEKVLKAEKDTWQEQLTWRRSFLDEAKGEKWERVLDALAAVALRTALERRELQDRLADLGPLPSLSLPASNIAESTSRALELYLTESSLASSLVLQRSSELAHLRQQGRELLDTRASLAKDGKVKKEHSGLDLLHLKALRDQRAQKLRAGMWELLKKGDPRAIVGEERDAQSAKTSNSRPNTRTPSATPSSAPQPTPASHLALLASLSTLSNPPPPIPLPSHTDISTTSAPSQTSAPPSSWSAALALDRERLRGLPTPVPPPAPHTAATGAAPSSAFNFSPPPSSSPSSSSRLLRPRPSSSSAPADDDSLELRISRILDSLDPSSPPPTSPASAPSTEQTELAGAKAPRRSRLPERVKIQSRVEVPEKGKGERVVVQGERERGKEPLKEVQPQPVSRQRDRASEREREEAPTPKALGLGKDAKRVLESMLDGDLSMSDEGEVGQVSY